MKQKIIIGIVTLGASLFLSGCGENVGKAIIEKTVESQTGGKVTIDADKGEMNIKSKDGEVSMSGDGSATLNSNFPKDIFVAPDAEIQFSMVSAEDKNYSVAYITGMTVDEIYSKYKDDLASKEWVADSQNEMTFGDSRAMLFKKGNERLSVLIGLSQDGQSKGKTSVQVIGATDTSAN